MSDRLTPEREAEILSHIEHGDLLLEDSLDLLNEMRRLRSLLDRAMEYTEHPIRCAIHERSISQVMAYGFPPCSCGLAELGREFG